jgi:hypothetical protein
MRLILSGAMRSQTMRRIKPFRPRIVPAFNSAGGGRQEFLPKEAGSFRGRTALVAQDVAAFRPIAVSGDAD